MHDAPFCRFAYCRWQMKLQLAQVPPKEHIRVTLEHLLPQYTYGFRVGRFVDCQKSFFTGASVVPKSDGIVVVGGFPSVGANMLFTLIMLGSGILIGLLLWLLVFRGGQNKVRDEVALALAQAYGAQLPPGFQPPQQQLQAPQNQMPQMQQPQQPYPQQPQQPQQPQYPQQSPPQQYQQPAEFPVGTRVVVVAQDGNRYPATIAQPAQQGQYLCTMQDGQSYWFPQQNVGQG